MNSLNKTINLLKDNKMSLYALAFLTFAVLVMSVSNAGSEGKEFSSVYDMLTGWAQGTLGRIICIAIVLVGIAGSVKNGTLMPIVIAIGAAIVLYNAPSIVDGILSATIDSNVAVDELQTVSNGMLK